MFGRIVTMTCKGEPDSEVLKSFANTIFNSEMYKPIVAQIKEFDGFCFKSNVLTEFKDDAVLESRLCFTDAASFEVYANTESTISLWDYLVDLGDGYGINVTIVDGDITS
jgi:hypothetical protein